MQAAAAQNDFLTPTVVSAAEADYQRNLANTVELFNLLANDAEHGAHNRALFAEWLKVHGPVALAAAKSLQPIWSQPRVKVAQFNDALANAIERTKTIASQIGIEVPATIGA
jgi:propane monooxygenase small subunit